MAGIYANPRIVTDLSDCYFYHTMDVPTIGVVEGSWDLKADMDDYLGNVAFNGKRVLDLGAANGMLSFHMESKGADVVSFDLESGADRDLVPLR